MSVWRLTEQRGGALSGARAGAGRSRELGSVGLACRASVRPSAPALEHLLDTYAYAVARLESLDAGHQQLVVVALAMTRRRDHRERDGPWLQRASGGGAPDSAAAAPRGVAGDRHRPLARAARKQPRDLAEKFPLELDVLARTSLAFALGSSRARVRVGHALGLLDRLLLDEDALALVG